MGFAPLDPVFAILPRTMRTLRTPLLIAALALALTGCLAKKSTLDAALAKNKDLEAQLADERKNVADRDNRIKGLEDELGATRGDLTTTDAERKRKEEELARTQAEKEATEAELAELRRQKEAAEARLASYRALQERFKSLVDAGTLEVAFRNGQMTLKLPSGVLFPSGSADLSSAGKTTLQQVTEALMAFKDRRFLVAGHTDSDPIKTRKFKNNWFLSTARAVQVVDFMVEAGFPADKLAAAGYADKDPVADNGTPEGKELNRRIEIILVPDLSELPQLAEEPK